MLHSIKKLERQKKITSTIVEQLRRMIQDGDLRPGARLPPEKDLIESFGVGRSSIREALQVLEHSGMVETKRGIGRFLTQDVEVVNNGFEWLSALKGAPALEIMEARQGLEILIVQLAAQRATATDIRDLQAILGRIAAIQDDFEAYLAEDLAFHARLAQSCGNSVLADLMGILIGRVYGQSEEFIKTSSTTITVTARCFTRLIEALKNRDPDAAGGLMAEHLGLVATALETVEEGK